MGGREYCELLVVKSLSETGDIEIVWIPQLLFLGKQRQNWHRGILFSMILWYLVSPIIPDQYYCIEDYNSCVL